MMNRKIWYQLFKYGVYLSVSINVFLFLKKDLASATHRFSDTYSFSEFIDAYTSTIDTGAWVVLLLLFELETYILSEKKLGNLRWLFRLIRTTCYLVIVSSFFGYVNGYFWLMEYQSIDLQGLCDVVGQSWMEELDDFKTITATDCNTLAEGKEFFKHPDKNVYTDNIYFQSTIWLTIVDIFNSLSWILVVVVLEIDVWLQVKNKFKGKTFTISKYIKNSLYAILLFAAIYWGIFGDFLEFWDAFLWIVAFVFIEMNLIEWKKNTKEKTT